MTTAPEFRRTKRSKRRFGSLAVLACLAPVLVLEACAPYPVTGRNPRLTSRTVEVPPAKALVVPQPGGPKVLTVLETQFANALEQEVVLATLTATPGQNAFHVVFFGPADGNVGAENNRKDDRLSDETLAEEIEERFPGVGMHMSTFFVQNRYGPFGYAIGRAGGGEMCLYGWQRIEAQVPLSPVIKSRGVINLRLRLCEKGATEPSLLRSMYGYSINGYFLPPSWNPYGRPMPQPEGIGRIGGPITFPEGRQGEGTVLDGPMGPAPAPARSAGPARARSSAEAAAPGQPQPPATPLPGYPVVPPPPGGQ
ncbi:MAG TPA: cellulose biosynthesis protein BcsN [Xanthobacteraceae bacterium]|nr:cellulose biosynthesis protein BcsN [Xanthobacteraceae bacterium]